MPYARKRTFKRYKRRAPSRKRTYKKRRKVSTTYRRRTSRKRVPKYVAAAYRGAFASLGNKFIRGSKMGITRWMTPFTTNIQSVPDIATTGKVLFASQTVDVTSAVFNAPYLDCLPGPSVYWAENWNMFACKYQRAQVRTAHVKCEFFIQDESDVQYLNSDYFLVGLHVSREKILPSQIGVSGDWEQWKKFGNYVIKKYTKNVSGWMQVEAHINVIKCMEANDMQDTKHAVWPTDRFSSEGVGVVPVRVQNSFPVARLYCTPFVVPLTRAQSSGAGNINVQLRISTRKRVIFDRPIVNAQGLSIQQNYPPIKSDLPAGYAPIPNLSSESLRIQELEARMDFDDAKDAINFDSLRANDNQQFARLDAIDLDQVTQDLRLSNMDDLNDEQDLKITNNTNTVQQTKLQFDQHVTLPANQAHG